jgi:hypothetical protein
MPVEVHGRESAEAGIAGKTGEAGERAINGGEQGEAACGQHARDVPVIRQVRDDRRRPGKGFGWRCGGLGGRKMCTWNSDLDQGSNRREKKAWIGVEVMAGLRWGECD